MAHTRQEHSEFLESELQAQTKLFVQKLETSAKHLLEESDELFVGQFLKIENGEMILKLSSKRGLPRKGGYLYCFTVPKEYRNFRNWGNMTYGDLIKLKGNSTEAVCLWQAPLKDDDNFCIAGFREIELDFANNLQDAAGMIMLLGPNKPPYEYIANLQKLVLTNQSDTVSQVLDYDFNDSELKPELLDNQNDISSFVLKQLSLNSTLILQGPPGTGKTYQIAEICKNLCNQGKSVLITSLTNRALIEVIEKPALSEILRAHRVYKTKVSADEASKIPDLQQIKDIIPQPGNLVLSTFYITSGVASNSNTGQQFDYVIVDEASQALLAMFGAAKSLGKYNIWFGDIKQLPPIVSINEDKILKKNYEVLVDGLKSLSYSSLFPTYQLSKSYRLPTRGANYTGLFYDNNLKSKANNEALLLHSYLPIEIKKYFNPEGGPTLIKTDLEVGNRKPLPAVQIASELVGNLISTNEKLHISVLAHFIETTKALQKTLYQNVGYHKNLLVETVSRIQGLTTDITIFVIPNSGYNRSLEKRLFNVATSRSKGHTLILADKDILNSSFSINTVVRQYLTKLEEDFSFYIPPKTNRIGASNDKGLTEKKDEPSKPPIETSEEMTAGEKEDALIGDKTSHIKIKVIDKIDLSKFEKPKKEIKKDKENLYIIDTNVFVDFPEIISKIDEQYPIILSAKVLDELDNLKSTLDKDGKIKVQKALKSINHHIDKRDLRMEVADLTLLPIDFNKRSPDNLILTVALKFKSENPILLTSDNGLQIKAKGLNVTTISLRQFLRR